MLASPVQVSLSALELAQAGRFDELRECFAPSLRPMVSAEALRSAWAASTEQLGQVSSVGTPVSESISGVTVVKVPLTCDRGAMTLIVTVTAAGQLTGLQLAPPEAIEPVAAWEPPGYVDPARFEEQELSLAAGPLAVGATLSLPRRGARPLPAVVLLPGSGPLDRDETIGPNKPFRDLAWGLASRGFVVLRFDKVTYAHGAESRAQADFTLTDEYVPHASAAIELLLGHPAVDHARVFVAGHSLGGTVAPRVAAAKPAVAGLVILAGGAEPLHWVIVRQIRYLASLDPATAASAAAGIETLTRQAEMVDSPELSAATSPSELPFGAPAAYWLDLRNYDAATAAAALRKPMLVLQGERDYQATVKDDLARWQTALADLPDVTIKVYPADDHFFFSGTGPSTPQDAMRAGQHVDPAVIDDLAHWLMKDH